MTVADLSCKSSGFRDSDVGLFCKLAFTSSQSFNLEDHFFLWYCALYGVLPKVGLCKACIITSLILACFFPNVWHKIS